MSNRAHRRHRTGRGLTVPRSAWPTEMLFAAVASGSHDELGEVFAAQAAAFEARVRGRELTAIRWTSVGADEARPVLAELGRDLTDHRELLEFCDGHPAGRLVIGYVAVEPRRSFLFGS